MPQVRHLQDGDNGDCYGVQSHNVVRIKHWHKCMYTCDGFRIVSGTEHASGNVSRFYQLLLSYGAVVSCENLH